MSVEVVRPRPWSTGDAGSFAHRTLAVRVPKILDDTVARNRFDADVLTRCRALRDEVTGRRLRGLVEDAPDRAAWDAACAPHVDAGATWLSIPWYFAEAFFYRRLLEATRYFTTGPGTDGREARPSTAGVDPFLPHKLEEESTVVARLASVPRDDLRALLLASLWGNRADLSYAVGRAHGDQGGSDDLLVDDSAAAIASLERARSVGLLLDNAGTELASDLLLASALAQRGVHVVLYAKDHPFFVSDAMPVDVVRTQALLGVREHFEVRAHPFMTSSGFLFTSEMPDDLVSMLRAHDIVIVKGDANYRRLVGDAPWPHTTPFVDAIEFPAPLVALRTLKAEVAVGLRDVDVERARARDLDWLTSGRFGVIQHQR